MEASRSSCSRYRWQIPLCIISFLFLFELVTLMKWTNLQDLIIGGSGDPAIELNPDQLNVPYSDLNASVSLRGKHFWKSHKPSCKCPSKLLNRVGGKGDGGKWVCGLQTLGTRTREKGYNCTVYSFGVAEDSSFEAEVLETTKCSIFAFDPTVNQIARPLKASNPRVHFNKIGLGGYDGRGKYTLKTLMDERGHKFIDILKIDVEGGEYESLERVMKDFKELPFGQLLVELHGGSSTNQKERVVTFVRNLEKMGTRAFSIEHNAVAPPSCCSEFSFINLKHLDLFFPLKNHQ